MPLRFRTAMRAVRFWVRGFALFGVAACSTALLPYSQEEDTEDAGSAEDAAATDASGARDAGRPDAAPADQPHDCTSELPVNGVASLFTQDCATRPLHPCTGQRELDLVLAKIASDCDVLRQPVRLGFTLEPDGCPAQLRYDQRWVLGSISSCMQSKLETLRFGCKLDCAVFSVTSLL